LLILLVITVGNIETASMRCSELNISWRLRFVLLLFVCVFLSSCTTYHVKTEQPRGVYHRIKSGETLWSIAKAYKINVQDLAEVNNITDPNLIEIDSVIFIPDANQVIEDVMTSAGAAGAAGEDDQKGKGLSSLNLPKEEQKTENVLSKQEKSSFNGQQKLSLKTPVPKDADASITTKHESQKTPRKINKEEISGVAAGKVPMKQDVVQKAEKPKERDNGVHSENIKFDKERFIWPVKGKIQSKFGVQPNGMYYNGIKISAKEGTPVLAAAGGTVIFSSSLKDYGETIIIKHEDDYATVYSNLGSRAVKVDDLIKKGNRIALLGKSDRRRDAFINFEIRYKNKARNPLFFLP
jgi:lipoprotein NlpD